jgi:hypothetical protein
VQARLLGFILEFGKGVTFTEFMGYLHSLCDQQIKYGEYQRLIYIGEKDNYYLGLFLTVKDQRKFCEIKEQDGEFKITVRSLQERSNLTDFNFFIINKSTARGMYQHYHQSCSLNQFGIFLNRQYEDLRDVHVETELSDVPEDDKRQRKAVEKKYKGRLKLEVMVRPEKLEEILEQLEKIQFFNFDFATLVSKEPLFNPITKYVKKESHRLRFNTEVVADGLGGHIASVVKSLAIKRGRVGGLDAEGKERTFQLLENPDNFGNFEYDDLADETTLNIKDVEKSPFFATMLDIATKNATMFQKAAQ